MAYVDLNPIRAALAETPEASDYTSIQQRINEVKTSAPVETEDLTVVLPKLMCFTGKLDCDGLPCELKDYLELVDWSGRAIHPNKRVKIADQQPKILRRLQIEPSALLRYLSRKNRFHHVIGSYTSIREAAIKLRKRFLQGIAAGFGIYRDLTGRSVRIHTNINALLVVCSFQSGV
jgi:hypothetical protein